MRFELEVRLQQNIVSMASKDSTNLRHLIDTFRILNMSDQESTVTEERFPFQNSFKDDSFIVTDVDEELLLLVAFHDFVDLHSIKIHAISPKDNDGKDNNDEEEDDEDDEDEDKPSAPKEVEIFKIDDLSKDFNDVHDMKPTHSISCSVKKLNKGQLINLKKKSKLAVKFKKIKYLAILIKSNQKSTETTFLSGIVLKGKSDAKLDDIPYVAASTKKKQKYSEIVTMFDKLGIFPIIHSFIHSLFVFIFFLCFKYINR